MKLRLPLNSKTFFSIVSRSEPRDVALFAKRAVEYLNGSDIELIDSYVDPFRIDTSEREANFLTIMRQYREDLLGMGFLPNYVEYVLSKITLERYRTVPSLDDIVQRVMRAPRLRTLEQADFAGVEHIFSPGKLELTYLQQKIYDHAVSQLPIRGAFVLATGFGKTVLAAYLAKSDFDAYSRLLFLVNSVVIKRQAELAFKEVLGVSCVDFDGNNYTNQQAVFCTFQGASKLPGEFISGVTHLIVDEAHHVLAPTFYEVFLQFRNRAVKMVAGFTATLTHLTDVDGRLLGEAFFGYLYCDLPWTTAKALGLFPPVRYIEILGPVGYRLQHFKGGSAYSNLLKEHMNSQNLTRFLREINISVRLSTLQLAQCLATCFAQFGPRSRTLCFLSSTNECNAFATLFNGMQSFSSCVAIHYRADASLVQGCLREFAQQGGSRVIATVAMATEGFDVPSVDCIMLGRSTQSERVFVQQMGRGLRKCAEKKDVLILDCVAALRMRWRRLREEQRDDEVWRQIAAFWDIESYV